MTNELTISEHLNWHWRHELLSMPVAFAPGEVTGSVIAVHCAEEGTTAGQLVDISFHGDGSVAAATCWFYGDLPGLATRTWSVDLACEPPATDLRIEPAEAGAVVVSNALLALKLPETAASGQQASGPLLAVRGVDGRWRGEGRLEGPLPCGGPRLVWEAAGPVFARARLEYDYPAGGSYVVTVEVRAGDEAVLIHEVCRAPEAACLVFDLGHSFDRGHWRPHTASFGKVTDPDNYRGSTYHTFALDFTQESVSGLIPHHSWEVDWSSWFAAYSSRADEHDWLAVFASHSDWWRGGSEARLQVETGPFGLRLRAPLAENERWWGLVVADRDQALVTEAMATNKCFQAQVRLAQLPLEKVRQWPLTWDRPADSYQPHLLMQAGQLPAIRRKASEWPAFRELFAARHQPPEQERDPAGAWLATGDLAYAQAACERVFTRLRKWLEDFLTKGYAFHELVAIALTRELRRTAIDWDLVAASEAVSEEDRRWADAVFAFLNLAITDPHYWPPDERGFYKGNVNFISDHYTCVATIACLLSAHPRRDAWVAWAENLLNDEFVLWTHPSGAWEEAPNYQGGTMLFLLPCLHMLRLNGYQGFREAETCKASLRYFGLIQTPYDPRRRAAMLPTVGDTTFSFHSQSQQNVYAWAARVFADDTEFAAAMMWHWQQGGALVCGVHDPVTIGRWCGALLLIDPALAAAEPQEMHGSHRLDGYGALLRQRNPAGEETYFLIKCGQAFNHYDPDELSFHYYGRGVPLALDYGCMYEPNNVQPWYHNRVSLAHKCDGARGEIAEFAALDAADYFAGEMVVDSLTEVPEKPDDPWGKAWVKPWEPIEPASVTRQVLLSRAGDYLVVADAVASDLPSDWSLHVLATGVEVQAEAACFSGQLGMDLRVFWHGDPRDRLETGRWSYAGRDPQDEERLAQWRECTLDLPVEVSGETQHFLRIWRGPGQGYLTLLLPHRPEEAWPAVERVPRGFHVQAARWEEWALLSERFTWVREGPLALRGRAGLVHRAGEKVTLCLLSGDCLSLGPARVDALGPISVTYDGDNVRGLSQGPKKRVVLRWPRQTEQVPRLAVAGEPYPAAYNPIMQGSRVSHLLVFTLPEGEHRFEVLT